MPPPSHRPQTDRRSTHGIKLTELETFLAVAESGSFSLAAEQLHVTQPSVTSRIQRLESILGTQLLERTTRKVDLTPSGRLLSEEAAKALHGLRALFENFRNTAQLSRQRVVVAATPTVAALPLPPIIHAYLDRFPGIQIELRDLQYEEALSALDSGAADFAVLSLDKEDVGYRYQLLWSDEIVLVAPAAHPLASLRVVGPEELATHPLMMLDQYQPMRLRIAHALEQRGLTLPACKKVRNLNTLLGMLEAGIGLTLLPRAMARRCRNAIFLDIEVKELDLRRDYGLVMSEKSVLTWAAANFWNFLHEVVNIETAADMPSDIFKLPISK